MPPEEADTLGSPHTPPSAMTSRLFLPALALALALTGCDAASDPIDSATGDDLADAAVAIGEAVSLNAGGLLDDAASLAALATPTAAKAAHPDRPGCEGNRTFDDAGTWTSTLACERGNPDGRFYASFARTTTHRFLDADGSPQQNPAGASSVEFAILNGEGTRRTPRHEHVLESLGASALVTDLDTDLVTVNGTYDRDGVNTFTGRNGGTREVDFALSLTATDVQGPRRGDDRRDRWAHAVAGTLSGLYTATITTTSPDGTTRVREVERTFTVTFPDEGGQRQARIAMGGQQFDADPATGALRD